MDVQRYISSGIIESYIVGLVSEHEAREMESAMAQYPEVRAAVDACLHDMENFVHLYAVKPPEGIRERILDVIDHEGQPEGAALLPEELREPAPPAPAEAVVAVEAERPQRNWQYMVMGAALMLAIGLVAAFLYAGRYRKLQQEHQRLLSAQTALSGEIQSYQTKLQTTERELGLMKDPGFKWISMQGSGKHAGQQAVVCWNPQSKETYVLPRLLPAPAPGSQYQLWAIVNGKPVDMGVFEAGPAHTSMQKMKPVTAAQAFTVTLEKTGGSAAPATEQLFVTGKVNGQ